MNQALCSLQSSGAALSPRRATHLFLLRQNKVSQKKATLLSASLRFAAGNLRCSLQAGSAQTRCAQTVCRPDPPEAPLLGADRRGGFRIRIRGALSPLRGLNSAMFLIAKNCTGFRGSFIAVKVCSTFSRSPIYTRLSKEFDDQIKLQRPD